MNKPEPARGPKPDGRHPRWVIKQQPELEKLPPIKEYTCKKTDGPIHVDGTISKKIWKESLWSDPFTHMVTDNKVPFDTRIALRWDNDYLYAAYEVEDPDVRAEMTGFHDHVYKLDEDVEFFIHGENGYFEIGTNALNNIYEIKWTWIKDVIEKNDHARIEELFMAPNFLYYPARPGEKYGRHGDLDWQLPGLKHAVRIQGAINCPEVKDEGWTVEFALPWKGLKPILGERFSPPKPGDECKITAFRCHQWKEKEKANQTEEEGWTWSLMGAVNIHVPKRWNRVIFAE